MSKWDTNQERPGNAPAMLAYTALPKFNPEKYRNHVKDFDLSEDEQTELLRTLWHIMAGFVDIGFGVESVQRLLPEFTEFSSQTEVDQLQQESNPTAAFNASIEDRGKSGEEQ